MIGSDAAYRAADAAGAGMTGIQMRTRTVRAAATAAAQTKAALGATGSVNCRQQGVEERA